jgi:hypothetical protein
MHRKAALVLALSLVSLSAHAADTRRYDIADPADMTALGCPVATSNDGASDSPTFDCIIARLCEDSSGGVIHVPLGIFELDNTIDLRCTLQLVGDASANPLVDTYTVPANQPYSSRASVLRRSPSISWKTKPLLMMRSSTIARDLTFDELQPDQPPFDENEFMIRVEGDDVLVENIMLFKAYQGIAVGGLGNSVGRVHLRNVRGQPLSIGILVDNAQDVVRVTDVHFWPFWSFAAGLHDVDKFVQTSGRGLVTKRNDNPFFSNLFFLGYSAGLVFETSAGAIGGSTSKAKVTGLDCDLCGVGILMDSTGASDNVVQSFSYLPNAEALGWRVPLLILGTENKIYVTEASVDQLPGAAVRITGSNHFVRVGQWQVRKWNAGGSGSAAFENAASGSRLWVRDSYGRWPNGGGTCTNAMLCEFALNQTF